MARHTKSTLFDLFEQALSSSGVRFLRLSGEEQHPLPYHVTGSRESYRVQAHIWNLTFGGRQALPDEWRIQVTGLAEGIQQFVQEPDSRTVILGWCEDYGVFAAYDVNCHSGPLGSSPSIQIRQSALEQARVNGLAAHFKGDNEVAFAVRPDYMGVYLENMEALHACGDSEDAIELIEDICENPQGTEDESALDRMTQERRFAIVSARRALRDTNFRERVLTAYSNTCAMCGMQLRMLDAAHILPAAHSASTDDTSNGVALCALHHRAFDRGLVTFDTKYRVHCNEDVIQELVASDLGGGLEEFRSRLYPTISVPPDRADRPAAAFVQQVNELRGWDI